MGAISTDAITGMWSLYFTGIPCAVFSQYQTFLITSWMGNVFISVRMQQLKYWIVVPGLIQCATTWLWRIKFFAQKKSIVWHVLLLPAYESVNYNFLGSQTDKNIIYIWKLISSYSVGQRLIDKWLFYSDYLHYGAQCVNHVMYRRTESQNGKIGFKNFIYTDISLLEWINY